MEFEPGTLTIFARLFLQTFALAGVFILAGQPLVRRLLPEGGNCVWPLSFRYGAGFFLGLGTFLVLFVVLSRLVGSARLGLWLSLTVLMAISVPELLAARRQRLPLHHHVCLIAMLLMLVTVFTVTNATLWFRPTPDSLSTEPRLMAHVGSIHSGRYANYSIYIAAHDRIPFIPQNMGQSLLAAVHMLLGVDAPLAGLMVWIPCSLAALASLIFGFLRSAGLRLSWAVGGTFFVLYCNLALSLVSVLVLDNGSPLAFAGYTDVIVSAGTILLTAIAVREALVDSGPRPRWTLALPALFGLVWSWSAPQNVVIAAALVTGVGLVWMYAHPTMRLQVARRLGTAAAIFGAAVVAGALQLGTFLPVAMREDIGVTVYPVETRVRVRPYVQFLTTVWTAPSTWILVDGMRPRVYEKNYSATKSRGLTGIIASTLSLFETNLIASLRIYGFLILALFLMHWRLRAPPASGLAGERLQAWFWMAAAAFLAGYTVVFGLEVDGIKWWLTRFLVPACVLCLTGLVLAVAPAEGTVPTLKRRVAWALLLVVAFFGPFLEFSDTFRENWRRMAAVDPLPHRLNLLAHSTGPFVLEDLSKQ